MHEIVDPSPQADTASKPPVTWHVDDVDWTPLTGLFIRKAGYKTVVPPAFTSDAYSIELTTIGVGGSSPTHVEPWAHVFYVLSGHGEVTVESEVKEVTAGSVSPIAAGQPHSFRVLGNEPLEMLVIYHPPRVRNAPKVAARVLQMRMESEGVISVELAAQDGAQLPAYEPGAHIDVHLPNGLVRSYSLCGNDPRSYRIGVLKDRASRGGSAYIHEQLRVGAVIDISVPRNNFPLHAHAKHSVFIAGGIGITPILAMLRHLSRSRASIELIYAARTRQEAAFLGEIEALGIPTTLHFDNEQGSAPDIRGILSRYPADTHFYACGPASMLDAYEAVAQELGLDHCHMERFTSKEIGASSQARESFRVILSRSGQSFDVTNGKSILDTLLDAGINVAHGCRQGICGTCKTSVLRGTPDHRDSVLSAKEHAAGNVMTVCVSGCQSEELVLDL